MDALTAAIDVGPLHGHRTGVGTAVAHLVDELHGRGDVELMPYLVSARAQPGPGERRLPLPAALATRAWAHADVPRVDRWLSGAEVVHGTNYVAPPSHLPTVISMYDCWFLAHPESATPPVRRAGAVLRRAVARGAYVHVSSTATADAARALLATDRIQVVHLGPPAAPATDPVGGSEAPASRDALPRSLHGRPYVLSIGTLERRKDIPTLVDAFGLLALDHRELALVVAGAPGDQAEEVAGRVAALPAEIGRRVHLVGAVTPGVKQRLLTDAAVLAYPSLDEGFGFPLLEAQAVSLPVVARRAGSIPEIGGEGVELVTIAAGERGHAELAAAIERVLVDTTRRDALVAGGHRNLARFSWASTAAGLVQLYRRAIEEAT